MASRNYILALDELGVDVEAIPKGFWSGSFKMSERIREKLRTLEGKKHDSDTPLISQQTPTHFNVDYPGFKFGYTVHETSKIVSVWREYINKMDELWTASNWAKDVFTNSGVDIPIYVVPHGVDRKLYHPKVKPLESPNLPEDKFVFLSVRSAVMWLHSSTCFNATI